MSVQLAGPWLRWLAFAGWLSSAVLSSAQTAETHPTVRCVGTTLGTPHAWVYVRPEGNARNSCGATWGEPCSDIEPGMSECVGKKPCALLVAPGIYKLKRSVSLPDGVHLFGGCMPANDVTEGSRSMLIAPDGGFPAVLVDRTVSPYTGIDGFYMMGTDGQNHVERRLTSQIKTQAESLAQREAMMPHANFAPLPSPSDAIQDPNTAKWYAEAQPSAVLYARSSTFSLRNVRVMAGDGGAGADGASGADGVDNSQQQFLGQAPSAEAGAANIMPCGHNAQQQLIPFGDLLLHADDWDVMVTPWRPHESPSGGSGSSPAKAYVGAGGGRGGFEGGASFGLLLFGSQVKLDHVEILGGNGGKGGNGGNGGNSLSSSLQPGRFPLNEPGAGGGGAGGWPGPSISLLYDGATELNEVTKTEFATDFLLFQFEQPSQAGLQGRRRDAECSAEPPAAMGPTLASYVAPRYQISSAILPARNPLKGFVQ